MTLLAAAPTHPASDFAAARRIVADLPALMDAARVRLGLTVTAQAKQVNIAGSTLTRLYAGSEPQQSTILACLAWLAEHTWN